MTETVFLKEFALISVLGLRFVVRVRTLFSDRVTNEEYAYLQELQGRVSIQTTPAQKDLLTQLKLVSDTPITPKTILAQDRAFVKHLKTAVFPCILELMVAQSCNMHCSYCYGEAGEYGAQGLMSRDTAFRAIDWYRDTLYRNDPEGKMEPQIIFFGGEPLLNEALIRECVLYCDSLWPKVNYGVTTNLTLMTEELLDFFLAHGVRLVVSYDGTPALQRKNRPMNDGRDSYEVFAEKASMLLKKAPDTPCRATRTLKDDESEMAKGILALGFRDYQINCVSGSLGVGTVREDVITEYDLDREHLLECAPVVAQAARLRDEKTLRDLWVNRRDTLFLIASLLAKSVAPRKLMNCGSGRTMFSLSVDGTWYPCHRFVGSDYRLGTLESGPDMCLCETIQFLDNPKCRACWLRYGCGHPCMHVCACDSPDEPGVSPLLRAPETYCEREKSVFAMRCWLHAALSGEQKQFVSDAVQQMLKELKGGSHS